MADRWRKSSYSNPSGNCVEVYRGRLVAGVRDSKDPGPVLTFTADEWAAFLAAMKEPPR